jgi:hypothetical protein
VLKNGAQFKKPTVEMLSLFHVCLGLHQNQISSMDGKMDVDSMHTRSKSLVYLFCFVLLCFVVILEIDLRTYTLSHSTSPFL